MPSGTSNFSWNKPTITGDNDVWGTYLNGNLDSQDTLVRALANCNIANSAPSIAQSGTLWINNTSNPWSLNVYDGTNWCTIGNINTTSHTFSPSGVSAFYVGDIKHSAQTANHGSWLLCNGQSVSTTTYSGLFALIGYTFGGSGANFSVPDVRGQVIGGIGQGTYTGASNRTAGQFVGEETHTLTSAELPNPLTSTAWTAAVQGGLSDTVIQSGTTAGSGIVGNNGGGNAHNNMQPTKFVGNYFIYTGV